MNTRDIQSLLNRYGFDAGAPDGVIGPQTRDASRRFQLSYNFAAGWLEPDGIAGPHTQRALDSVLATGLLSAHFSVDEARCKHCGRSGVKREWLQAAEALRDRLGHATGYLSIYRCVEHNNNLYRARGQRPTQSQHIFGSAGDPNFRVSIATVRSIGRFSGIGTRDGQIAVHLDVRHQSGFNPTRSTPANPAIFAE